MKKSEMINEIFFKTNLSVPDITEVLDMIQPYLENPRILTKNNEKGTFGWYMSYIGYPFKITVWEDE